jgi:hypothetical protein
LFLPRFDLLARAGKLHFSVFNDFFLLLNAVGADPPRVQSVKRNRKTGLSFSLLSFFAEGKKCFRIEAG